MHHRPDISPRLRAARATAGFTPHYQPGDAVHLVGSHPWTGARGVVLGEEYIPMHARVLYRVLLSGKWAKYAGHTCFARDAQLLPAEE